jgi:hypothetical protein
MFLLYLSRFFPTLIFLKKDFQKKIKPGFGVSVLHPNIGGLVGLCFYFSPYYNPPYNRRVDIEDHTIARWFL